MKAHLNLILVITRRCLMASFLTVSVLAGCGDSLQGQPSLKSSGTLSPSISAKQYVSRFGRVQGAKLERYIQRVVNRLGQQQRDLAIIVLNSATPIAFTPGAPYILVSTRFLRSISNEAEFAFVIAHELGHILLDHHSAGSTARGVATDIEKEADAFAVHLIERAGYSVTAALSATVRAYDSLGADSWHGAAEDRVLALREIVERKSPEGELNTRDYLLFVSLLP